MGIIARNTLKNTEKLPRISLLIKNHRVSLGLSQKELSLQIGVGVKTLRKIEQGDLSVNYTKLTYLLNFFGLGLQAVELVTSPVDRKKETFDQDYIMELLAHLYPILKLRFGVRELALFGSYAKDKASLDSDIDILLDVDTGLSFEDEGEIQLILENLFGGCKIDLTFKKNLHEAYIDEIEESKINVG